MRAAAIRFAAMLVRMLARGIVLTTRHIRR